MANPGATGRYHWTPRNPKGPASEPVRLVKPDGTLAGVTLETLQNGWGADLDANRDRLEKLILNRLNADDSVAKRIQASGMAHLLARLSARIRNKDDLDAIERALTDYCELYGTTQLLGISNRGFVLELRKDN